MVTRGEDRIEKFIRENRDELSASAPPDNHLDKFLHRLNRRIRHMINIVPYLIRVAVATIIIFTASVIVWNNFIRKDRNAITLRDKISLEIYRLLD
jgi:hypothetical protein